MGRINLILAMLVLPLVLLSCTSDFWGNDEPDFMFFHFEEVTHEPSVVNTGDTVLISYKMGSERNSNRAASAASRRR